jgi:hypothetical protein
MASFWTTKGGKEIPINQIEDQYLINILRQLQRNGELKRLAIISVYEEMPDLGGGVALEHFNKMYDQVNRMIWLDFVDDIFHDLQYEAARRKLSWDRYRGGPITACVDGIGAIDVNGPRRGSLERAIVGAIRDSINAHGAVTIATSPSASKRIIGVIKQWNKRISKSED